MGKSSGCVLILAGLAVAAYALYPRPQAGPETAAAKALAQTATAAGDGEEPPASKPVPEAADGPAANAGKAEPAAAPTPQSAPKPVSEPANSEKKAPPAQRPRTAVSDVGVDEAPARVPVGEVKTAAPPLDRAALTREIQRELKRIGCYRGDVTGIWSPSVRQAMRAFTERANASLPVNEPDPVLLAMAQSHAPGVCSAACPQGQDRAGDGRCVPSALIASAAAAKGGASAVGDAAKSGAKKRAGASAAVAGVPAGQPALAAPPAAYRPTDGRMSLAGPPAAKAQPVPRPQATPRRAAKVAGWSRSARVRDGRAQRPAYSGLPSWALPFLMP